jgi:hypothetical protein
MLLQGAFVLELLDGLLPRAMVVQRLFSLACVKNLSL